MSNEVDDSKDCSIILRWKKSCNWNIADVEAHGSTNSAKADNKRYNPCGIIFIVEKRIVSKEGYSTYHSNNIGEYDTLSDGNPLEEDTTRCKSCHVSNSKANWIDKNAPWEVL